MIYKTGQIENLEAPKITVNVAIPIFGSGSLSRLGIQKHAKSMQMWSPTVWLI
jgi:hypothetical protein